jgi:hypothetical protein
MELQKKNGYKLSTHISMVTDRQQYRKRHGDSSGTFAVGSWYQRTDEEAADCEDSVRAAVNCNYEL